MKVKKFQLGPMMTNCFLAWTEDKTAYFFDCGGSNLEKVIAFVKKEGLKMKHLVLTHGHGDHIAGLNDFIKAFPEAKVYIGKEDQVFLNDNNLNLMPYITGQNFHYSGKSQTVKGGDMLGDFLVIDTPGHTIGSKCFYYKKDNLLFAGDTLFYHSYGRFDFPTGNRNQLVDSLRKLCKLPKETIVYNGHTEDTSIGEEKKYLGL